MSRFTQAYGTETLLMRGVNGASKVSYTQTITTAGNATNITFNLAGGYNNVRINFLGRSQQAAVFTNMILVFNGDNGPNYDWVWNASNAAASATSGAAAANNIVIAEIAGANAPANVGDMCSIDIPGYTNTIFQKAVDGRSTYKAGTGANNQTIVLAGGWWRSTAAIIGISLALGGQAFVNGSQATCEEF